MSPQIGREPTEKWPVKDRHPKYTPTLKIEWDREQPKLKLSRGSKQPHQRTTQRNKLKKDDPHLASLKTMRRHYCTAECWHGLGSSGSPYSLTAGMQSSTATLEDSLYGLLFQPQHSEEVKLERQQDQCFSKTVGEGNKQEEHKDAYSIQQWPVSLKGCIYHCRYAQLHILYNTKSDPNMEVMCVQVDGLWLRYLSGATQQWEQWADGN